MSASAGSYFNFTGATPTINGNGIWHAGNDGSGSGLDSDYLRGLAPDATGIAGTIAQRHPDGTLRAGNFMATNSTNSGTMYLGGNGVHYLSFDTVSYQMPSGSLIVGGNIHANGDSFETRVAGGAVNSHFIHNHGGVQRGRTLYEGSSSSMLWALYNSSGAYVRQMAFRESDGRLAVDGPILASGSNITAGGSLVSDNGVYAGGTGGAMFATDGNIIFKAGMASAFGTSLFTALSDRVKNDGGTYGINVSGFSQASNRITSGGTTGGLQMTFNWNGLGGQPQWVWGGDAGSTGTQMYVYNPAGFNVDRVDGYHAADFWRFDQTGGGYGSGWQKLPTGLIIMWGSAVVTTDGSGYGTTYFPTSFPNTRFNVVATHGNVNGHPTLQVHDSVSNAGFSFYTGATGTIRLNWTAFGY